MRADYRIHDEAETATYFWLQQIFQPPLAVDASSVADKHSTSLMRLRLNVAGLFMDGFVCREYTRSC